MFAAEYTITLPDEKLLAAEVGRTRQAMEASVARPMMGIHEERTSE